MLALREAGVGVDMGRIASGAAAHGVGLAVRGDDRVVAVAARWR